MSFAGKYFVDNNRRIYAIFGELCRGYCSANKYDSLGRFIEARVISVKQLEQWPGFPTLEAARARIRSEQNSFAARFVVETGAQQ